ncbi:DUF4253 domain-containing protein [Actinokineospora soli]|uniref:DUF4253 domain-containing protein n=1 Tax=Actinokineospora soli TaxID=1048753 RepID=A0ABW2TXB0_9PSEU
MLEDLAEDEESRSWVTDDLLPERMSAPGLHDAAELLAGYWQEFEEEGPWPGLAPRLEPQGDPDRGAEEFADELLEAYPAMRLGLVAAERGADTLAVMGWTGPVNHVGDTGQLSAVLRSWEDRFGAWVVGVGFATLYLSVAAPPVTVEQAVAVAAEHLAFCPDNVWQGPAPQTLEGYAERIAGARAWGFWWD